MDAPGEGNRKAPAAGEVDEKVVPPPPGPQMDSKGIAPSEVQPLSDAYKNATPTEYPVGDAPGEGSKRMPEVSRGTPTLVGVFFLHLVRYNDQHESKLHLVPLHGLIFLSTRLHLRVRRRSARTRSVTLVLHLSHPRVALVVVIVEILRRLW